LTLLFSDLHAAQGQGEGLHTSTLSAFATNAIRAAMPTAPRMYVQASFLAAGFSTRRLWLE